MTSDIFSFLSLGGIGETGFNSYLFNVKGDKFIVDLGIAMPTPFMPATATIIPDVRSMKEIFKDIKALIFTHGHEDHIGAYPYFRELLDVPIIGSPLTIELINIKLKEMKKEPIKNFISLTGNKPSVKIGDKEIRFFKTKHSIPQSYGMFFDTPFGYVVFTSDFKEIYDLKNIPDNPFILFFDATNSEIKENKDELEVNRNIERLFKDTKGAIIISTFSTNLERIKKIVKLSRKYDKKIFLSGKNLENTVKIGKKLNIFDDFPIEDFGKINKYKRNKIVLLTTGSQGERYSSLNFISMGNFKGFKIKPEDSVIISSSIIPRNEIYIYDMINRLSEKGAMVYYAKTDDIHTSGHASIKELSHVLSHFNPHYIVPIHGEHRQLSMARKFIHSKKDNDFSILSPNPGDEYIFRAKDKINIKSHSVKKLYIDEDSNLFVSFDVIKERKKLSEDGIIVVNIDKEITFESYGIIDEDSDLWSELHSFIREKIRIIFAEAVDTKSLQETLKKDVKSLLKKKINKKPFIVINFRGDNVS